MALLFCCQVFTSGQKEKMDIAAWPKLELHLHLDCSLSYELVSRLDPSITPDRYHREFIAPARCINLADFITRAVREIDLMQTEQQLRLAVLDVFSQLQKDHVIYAEIRFAPLQHLQKGLTPQQVVAAVNQAVTQGTRATGIQMGVILCTLRHYSGAQSMETVHLVGQFRNTNIVGFDIAADEAGYPLDNHIAAYKYAHEHEIPCTAHAGEASGPHSVWDTFLDLRPSRIGHGVRSIEDPGLVTFLRQQDIHLEVCPTSNLQTNIYEKMSDHPVDKLYRSGISLGISTDARTISNTTLNKEYAHIEENFHWTKKDFLAVNLAALEHAFTSKENKRKLKEILLKGYGQ